MENENNIIAIDNTRRYSAEQFDKNILFIASGAFGISFAFIKDIVPNLDTAVCKNYLMASWIIFSGVIFISLVGHYIAMIAGNFALTHANLEPEDFNAKIKPWNRILKILNAVPIVAILIGALALIHFISKNI